MNVEDYFKYTWICLFKEYMSLNGFEASFKVSRVGSYKSGSSQQQFAFGCRHVQRCLTVLSLFVSAGIHVYLRCFHHYCNKTSCVCMLVSMCACIKFVYIAQLFHGCLLSSYEYDRNFLLYGCCLVEVNGIGVLMQKKKHNCV